MSSGDGELMRSAAAVPTGSASYKAANQRFSDGSYKADHIHVPSGGSLRAYIEKAKTNGISDSQLLSDLGFQTPAIQDQLAAQTYLKQLIDKAPEEGFIDLTTAVGYFNNNYTQGKTNAVTLANSFLQENIVGRPGSRK